APLTGLAWQAQEGAGRCLDAALTVLAAVASQAFYVTERAVPPELVDLLDIVRSHFPPVTNAQTFAPPLASLMARLRNRIYDVDEGLRE
ncbi:MAG TPA: hypothetical protein VFG64_01835, partial [Dongiaceae bacterium]|nr:hypothetical protein [Dongiaceae bacterium]